MSKLIEGKVVYLIDTQNGYGISGCVYLGEAEGQYGGTYHLVQKIECQTVIDKLSANEIITNFTEAELRVTEYKAYQTSTLVAKIEKLQAELNKFK